MNWYLNLKIKTKLLSSFLIVVIFLIVIGATTIANLNSVNNSKSQLYDDALLPIEYLSDIESNIIRIRLLLVNLLYLLS